MKTYEVTIKAEIVKVVQVEAPSQEEAEAVAHETFTPLPDPGIRAYQTKYHQQTISINAL